MERECVSVLYEEEDEEDYIEMELRSSPSASNSNSSPQSCREFEFSAAAASHQQTTADHLFHKGRLLPLYIIPSSYSATAATPIGSSPSESCRASCDLAADDFFFEWSNDLNTFINPQIKPSWPKKLKHSILAHKLRASKAYLKSLFVKSAKPNSAPAPAPAPIRKPTTIANVIADDNNNNQQRRSFSSAIKRHSPTKCLSSSSSNSSSASSSFSLNSNNGIQDLHSLGRSSSATEIDGSIEAAIAHCKKSFHV